jgi:hypothetical protein
MGRYLVGGKMLQLFRNKNSYCLYYNETLLKTFINLAWDDVFEVVLNMAADYDADLVITGVA